MSLVELVKEAGVIGAGGAGFPTHVKLQGKADYVLLNGAECEPLLRVDQQLMEFHAEEVIAGLYLAAKQVEADKAIIGIKIKHTKVIEILRQKVIELGFEEKVEVKELPDIYPAGDEQVLVYQLTGRVVPELGIPMAVGCVVINTETALNIFNAANNKPVTMKYVTIAGAVPKPITVKVPVGTPMQDLFKMAGLKSLEGLEVIDGGPMMGPLLYNKESYVTKKTKGLVVLPEDHDLIGKKNHEMRAAKTWNKSACEQCRMCTDLCPRALLGHSTVPHKMVRAMSVSNIVPLEEVTASQTCCQCNLCEYFSCPAGINPKMANTYFMVKLRSEGIRHVPRDSFKPHSMRDYRLVPSKRLMGRINILDYDKPAPLEEEMEYMPEVVGISLGAHVGAPAEALVKVGDKVTCGQKIAQTADDKLGASVHSSIDGVVESVTRGVILIRRG